MTVRTWLTEKLIDFISSKIYSYIDRETNFAPLGTLVQSDGAVSQSLDNNLQVFLCTLSFSVYCLYLANESKQKDCYGY